MNFIAGDDTLVDKLDFDFNDQDWILYLLEQYFRTVITAPLLIHETLLETQYQKREVEEKDHDFLINQKPLYLTRLSDFASTIRAVTDFERTYFSILKGHLTQYLHYSLFDIIQPAIEESLNDMFDIYEDQNIYTAIVSNTISGVFLSPLELIRTRYYNLTRLIVQATDSNRKKYFGPFHCFFTIYSQEKPSQDAGIISTFYNLRNVFPALLVYSISPIIRYASMAFVEQRMGLDPHFTPILYKIMQLASIG